ncbi:hypothetical protein [Amycolatopsis sp. WGS_07]|uniref:hypothetical protein n=1 Tax=Amycolatopsis sp. WGS_07 TaxID=3076764 RepID=UPI0038738FDA
MESETLPAIGAQIRLALSIGSMSWHGYRVVCPHCGACGRWGLVVWSLPGEGVARASGLCERAHWVDDPVITPGLVTGIASAGQEPLTDGATGQDRIDAARAGWMPSVAVRVQPGAVAARREDWPRRGFSGHERRERAELYRTWYSVAGGGDVPPCRLEAAQASRPADGDHPEHAWNRGLGDRPSPRVDGWFLQRVGMQPFPRLLTPTSLDRHDPSQAWRTPEDAEAAISPARLRTQWPVRVVRGGPAARQHPTGGQPRHPADDGQERAGAHVGNTDTGS